MSLSLRHAGDASCRCDRSSRPSFAISPSQPSSSACCQQRPAVVQRDVAQPNPFRRRAAWLDALLQPQPSGGQRQRTKVFVAVTEQVEQEQHGWLCCSARSMSVGERQVDASLDVLEPERRSVASDRDDLAVEEHGSLQFRRDRAQRLDDRRELCGLLAPVSRVDRDMRRCARARRRADIHERANAVVFGLVNEALLLQRLRLGKRRQHGSNAGRIFAPLGHDEQRIPHLHLVHFRAGCNAPSV